MKLHLDRESFLALLIQISERTGIRIDILEKDYYVTLLLWELSGKQTSLPAYFKGGTALYKALKTLNRFSEDIDLTVEVKDVSNSQAKKRLENAAKHYNQLARTSKKSMEQNRKGSITCVYEYQPVSVFDQADALQRFGYVKVEATSFTISEPHESLSIEPIIFSAASISEREILSKQYDVKPFGIKTIKLERIFVDKILAAEFYYQRNRLFDVSKHLYDLTIMLKQERIMLLLENNIFLNEMLNYKRKEEKYRMGSDLAKKPLSDFILYAQLKNDQALKDNFEHMQSIYVFSKKDLLNFDDLVIALQGMYEKLKQLDELLVNDEDFN